MGRILALWQDQTLAMQLRDTLQPLGIEVIMTDHKNIAERYWKAELAQTDVVLINATAFQKDALSFCKKIRQQYEFIGIILLTDGLLLTKEAFSHGADDCMCQPFDLSELSYRIQALTRRVAYCRFLLSRQDEYDEMVLSGYVLNLKKHTLTKNGQPIELTQIEYQMIRCFFQNRDKLLRREDILTFVWGGNYYGEEKVVDVNVRRLRLKIEDDPSRPKHLLTVWGKGYQWKSEPTDSIEKETGKDDENG